MHDSYIGRCFRWTKITRKASDAAENLQLYRVLRFFRPRSSCTRHISADVQRITLNASSWITISGRRNEQLDTIAGFLPRHWLYEWFSQFHCCGTYSVLSRSPSFIQVWASQSPLLSLQLPLIEGLRERTEYIDIFLFSAHHSIVFCCWCSVYWWKGSVRF